MLKCGIIGFGKMGRIRYDAILASNLGEVAITYDPFCSDLKGIRKADTAQQIIDDPKIDAVFIATPNYHNLPLTLAGLNAGKHVFCEKPPAFTEAEIQIIQKAEARSGKKLMYGFNHRHHQSVRDIKKMVASGEYGRVLWMRGRYGKSVDSNYFNTWRAKRELAGGGILLDQGIHMLDLFIYLGGQFDQVQAMISNLYWNLNDIEDNAFLNLKNSRTGLVASLHSTMTQWRHLFSLEVFLEKGYIVLNGLKTQSGSYGDEVLTIAKNRSTAPAATWEDEEKKIYHLDNSWNDETLYFLEHIFSGEDIEMGSSTDAQNVMRIIDSAYRDRANLKPSMP